VLVFDCAQIGDFSMAETSNSPPATETQRTHDFIMNKDGNTYVPFTIVDGKRYLWCIHPTDEDIEGPLRISVQTGGGAHGEAMHSSLALSNVEDRYVSPNEALVREINLREHTTIMALHDICAFAKHYKQVLQHMSNPHPITEDTVERWMFLHGVGNRKTRTQLITEVREGAAYQLEELEEARVKTEDLTEDLAQIADSCSPYTTRTDTVQPNKALNFVTNHTPHLGLNRQLLHRSENPLEVQLYHDSLGAVLLDTRLTRYNDEQRHPEKLRALKMASMIQGSASVRTLLSFPEPVGISLQPNRLYEVFMGKNGPEVEVSELKK
jgi:hypothetical protein